MRWMLAGWAGLAGVAGGREVPVHREYTKPVVIYDESGARVARGGGVPDREAWLFVREAKALEGLVGKETLLTMTLGHGGSVLQGGETVPMAPQMMVEGGRREKGESKGNWLVQSLTIPSMGQNASNAAVSAMSIGEVESGWGWLADEVSKAAWGIEQSAELPLPEEPRAAANPEGSPSPGSYSATWNGQESAGERERPGMFDRPPEDGTGTTDREDWTPGMASYSRESGGGGRREKAVVSWSTKGGMGDGGGLSQTRRMMADLTASVRPGAEAWKGTEGGIGRTEATSIDPGWGAGLERARDSLAGGLGGGDRGRVDTGVQAGKPIGISTWQGGWNVSAGGTAGGNSSYGPPSAPAWTGGGSAMPLRERSGVSAASGGAYKPAWH